MENQIRILHVLGRLDRGGAETMLMNLYRYMDRSRIQFDFVIHTEDVCDYTEEVKRLGGRIYSMEPFRVSTAFRYRRQWRRFLKAHPEYTIIHGHMRSTASLYLWEAKRAGLTTIVHSHNTSSGKGLSAVVKNVLQYPLRYEADYLFSCSKLAGIWLYGKAACEKKKFRLLCNGIEPGSFRFDPVMREQKRRELLDNMTCVSENKEDVLLLLHLGRLETQKNHGFLLRIMKELTAHDKNILLFLCGMGPLEQTILSQIEEYGLQEQVCLLGVRADVPMLLQAADGMIFPSLFEGLPVTLVEAQASGLPILMSDTITQEVALTELVRTLPLTASPERWAQEALAMLRPENEALAQRLSERGKYADIIARKGYDVEKNAAELAAFYSSLKRRKS